MALLCIMAYCFRKRKVYFVTVTLRCHRVTPPRSQPLSSSPSPAGLEGAQEVGPLDGGNGSGAEAVVGRSDRKHVFLFQLLSLHMF